VGSSRSSVSAYNAVAIFRMNDALRVGVQSAVIFNGKGDVVKKKVWRKSDETRQYPIYNRVQVPSATSVASQIVRGRQMCYCHVRRNVETTSTDDAAKPRKPEVHIRVQPRFKGPWHRLRVATTNSARRM
jgi:hypothetical protein